VTAVVLNRRCSLLIVLTAYRRIAMFASCLKNLTVKQSLLIFVVVVVVVVVV